MVKILHLADLHLGRSHSYLGNKAPERKREADGLLGRVADYILNERPDIGVVLIAGDLFESYRPEDTLVAETIGHLRRLVGAGKTVITLPGNHDELSYRDCVYRKHGGVWPGILVTSPTWVKVETVETPDGPCHFYGMAYQAGITPDTLEPSVPLEPDGLHVAILHASVGLPGKDRAIRAGWDDLGALGVDYVALGHVHKPDQKRLSHGTAVYPGLIEGSGFGDPGCGEVTVVTLQGPSAEVERIPIRARRIETREIDLGLFDDPDGVRRAIEESADPERILLVRLTGAAGFEPATDFICGELAHRFYHLKIEEDFTLVEAADVDAAAGEETVLGWVIRDLRQRGVEADTAGGRAVAERALRHAWNAFRGGGTRG